MLVFWNCVDVWFKVVEYWVEMGDVDGVLTFYRELFFLYERVCGFCDVNWGDDLSGLLYDWGCSLMSYVLFLV